MEKFIIPTTTYTKIVDYVSNIDTSDKQKNKLIRHFINVYITISLEDYIRDNKFKNIHSDFFTTLKIDIVINKKRYTYKTILTIMEELDLLEIRTSYKTDNFPKGYYLKETYELGLDYTYIDIDKLILTQGNTISYYKNKYRKYTKLINDMSNSYVDLVKLYEHLRMNMGKVLKLNKKGEEVILDDMKVMEIYNSAVAFNLKRYYITIPSNTKRFYSSFANLNSQCDDFIYERKTGKKLDTILDIPNSQPLLLSILLKKHKVKNIDKYISDVENNNFYNQFYDEEMLEKYGEDITRKKTKVSLYRDIFFANNILKSKPYVKKFIEIYGSDIIDFVINLDNLWEELQNTESQIIIPICLKKDYITLTKHDGVFVMSEYADDLKKSIEEEILEYGIKVTLNKK